MPQSPEPAPENALGGEAFGRQVGVDAAVNADFLVVAIGASAGGLAACTKLVESFPNRTGMAFVLVQHLDPTHESLMVDLLATHTALKVVQAEENMPLQVEHLYVIPPGSYLAVKDNRLTLSNPEVRHGARLPFDFFLNSLAAAGRRAVAVVLSGTGSDGSLGLAVLTQSGGFVIAQDPLEAAFGGMPTSAIETGLVDLVLPIADIPAALMRHQSDGRGAAAHDMDEAVAETFSQQGTLEDIVALLRTKTVHNFSLYKTGTLQRRIERRMALLSIDARNMGKYLQILGKDKTELDLLAKDLLIHVTNFFRDTKVFDLLHSKIVPELVRAATDRPLRVWVAGCSTGEEAYSLTMLFREVLQAAKSNLKLQVFASDVDADSIAVAREGLYPTTIEADVSPERLARFFTKEGHGYRVQPDLRATIVFTVQDVLVDPPFSRLDLVSCRNLLIYLGAEAQAKAIALFHFALRSGGILLLGSSETIGNFGERFEVVAKAERIFRHVGLSRPGDFGFALAAIEGQRAQIRSGRVSGASRQAILAELCRRILLESFAPAAVLINAKNECLYTSGATDRFLRVAPGHPTHDLFAMTPPIFQTKMRTAIQQARAGTVPALVSGCRIEHDGAIINFSISVQSVMSEGEELLLVCFLEDKKHERQSAAGLAAGEATQVSELEQELRVTRAELQEAIRHLEISSEEQKAINEEAWSVNEEYQSTNEELLTSKEELQSLNEELTALNTQLQETLERQRTTSNDLQNVLYSTDVATLFLDTKLNIRFFTPATKSVFSVIASDVGRPLADLRSLAVDTELLSDAAAVLETSQPVERQISTRAGVWFVRRILPYMADNSSVGGVVITFTDISERKAIGDALDAAKRTAQSANDAKSRFLAAASHDLRQPLQTLTLLQGLLASKAETEREKKLLARFEDTLGAMAGMLNALLDVNQIESGIVQANVVDFPINTLLDQLREEFSYSALAKGLKFKVVACGLTIRSDPRLLVQMVRNLLSNALKYTQKGSILLGCRRKSGKLSVEIWDTGLGIAKQDLSAIFEEYHQLDNAARERSRGLGLGLSIVKRLGNLLGHEIKVTSHFGKGSAFAVEILLPVEAGARREPAGVTLPVKQVMPQSVNRGSVLVIEDDPEVRELLEVFLQGEGHETVSASDGPSALELMANGIVRPDLILADYNLPNGMTGLEIAGKLRGKLGLKTPVIILTGDISTLTLRTLAGADCVHLNKPVRLKELLQTVQRLLKPVANAPDFVAAAAVLTPGATIYIVDDDDAIRAGIRSLLEEGGQTVADFASCEAFLEAFKPGLDACLLIDAYLPGMNGLDLLRLLQERGDHLPSIMITGRADVVTAVEAMKCGATDFLEKPFNQSELLTSIERALEQSRDANKRTSWRATAAEHLRGLTARQHEVMKMVLAGHPSKNIAADLGISQRTVENHRASIMKRTGTKSLPALARLVLASGKD